MKKILSFKRILFILTLMLFILANPSFAAESNEKAIFAGGCFWCLEHDLENVEGIISAKSGYTGGDLANPNYKNHVGHQEAVLVKFDPKKISFEKLLRTYWRNIDPFDNTGQFCDKGSAYKPIIFTLNDEQLESANLSISKAAQELSVPADEIAVKIKSGDIFWPAEDYHQDYAIKNNIKYNFYRYSCGRDNRLNEVWGENSQSSSNWKD